MANSLHDLLDRLGEASWAELSGEPSPGRPVAGAPIDRSVPHGGSAVGWPVEPADLFVVDPGRPVAVSTLGDVDLARAVAETRHPGLALAAPTATENIGVEKLVRNLLADPAVRVLVVAGPETGGTAPTGHYAGDALVRMWEAGVDATTMRIVGAKGRRPVLKNLAQAEVEAFRRHIRLVDLRGEREIAVILAAVTEAAGTVTDASAAMTRPPAAAGGVPEAAAPAPEVAAASPAEGSAPIPMLSDTSPYRPDPVGYVLIFVDRVNGCLVVEHYTGSHRRTAQLTGPDPAALSREVVCRGLVGTLEHAAYVGRELQRAADSVVMGLPYVQD